MKRNINSYLDAIILRNRRRKQWQEFKEWALHVATLLGITVIATLVFFNLFYRG